MCRALRAICSGCFRCPSGQTIAVAPHPAPPIGSWHTVVPVRWKSTSGTDTVECFWSNKAAQRQNYNLNTNENANIKMPSKNIEFFLNALFSDFFFQLRGEGVNLRMTFWARIFNAEGIVSVVKIGQQSIDRTSVKICNLRCLHCSLVGVKFG